jgi:hypothetical protein
LHAALTTRIKQCCDGLGMRFIGNEEAAIILTPNARRQLGGSCKISQTAASINSHQSSAPCGRGMEPDPAAQARVLT